MQRVGHHQSGGRGGAIVLETLSKRRYRDDDDVR